MTSSISSASTPWPVTMKNPLVAQAASRASATSSTLAGAAEPLPLRVPLMSMVGTVCMLLLPSW